MKIAVTADWHLDARNRLPDFIKSISEIIDHVISAEIKKLFIVGDLYRDWRASPVERDAFHRLMLRLHKCKVDTFIILGNHDVDDRDPSNSLNSAQELETLKALNIRVIASPEIISVGNHNILAVPHLSKRYLDHERRTSGRDISYIDVINKFSKFPISLLLGHMFISEAVSAPAVESARAVSLSDLKGACSFPVILGDVHQPVALRSQPFLGYVGSPDRINFGEASDKKRFIIYDLSCGSMESVPIPNRDFVDIKIDLDESKIYTEGCANGTIDLDPQDQMANILAFLSAAAPYVIDSVVKLSVRGHRDKMAVLIKRDISDKLKSLNPHYIKSVSFTITDTTSARDSAYSTIPSDEDAFRYWISGRDYAEDIKARVSDSGLAMIKKL